MKILKRTWDVLGWVAGGYAVYNQLKNLSQAKDDLYYQLSPDQQANWIKVFGQPDAANHVVAPQMPGVVIHAPATTPVASNIDQLKAGT